MDKSPDSHPALSPSRCPSDQAERAGPPNWPWPEIVDWETGAETGTADWSRAEAAVVPSAAGESGHADPGDRAMGAEVRDTGCSRTGAGDGDGGRSRWRSERRDRASDGSHKRQRRRRQRRRPMTGAGARLAAGLQRQRRPRPSHVSHSSRECSFRANIPQTAETWDRLS